MRESPQDTDTVLVDSHSPRRAEGIDAFVRGDYATAADILKPIAESPSARDVGAQFLMASLYESGLGIGADPERACALYSRSLTGTANPIS
jgi:TPR repeat protein